MVIVMKTLTLDSLIDIALALVDRYKSVRSLSFREVAREAGCSHVNLYNYVANVGELVWRCYCRGIVLYRDFCAVRSSNGPEGERALVSYTRAVLEFARTREGLYRLLWLEDLGAEPPGFVMETVAEVSGDFRAFVAVSLGQEAAAEVADLFGSWLLGKMAFLLNGRFAGGRDAAERAIVEGARSLETSLFEGKGVNIW